MICNVDPNRECTRIDTKENHESRESTRIGFWFFMDLSRI